MSEPTHTPHLNDLLNLAPDQVLRRDAHRLRSWLERIRRLPAAEQTAAATKWLAARDESQRRLAGRCERFPRPVLDASLPVAERADEIRAAIAEHPVVILSGETGSGKSTQLPLIALQLGLGQRGLIGHTQPRRLAARGVAARLAQQLGSPLGTDVGYKIRFTDQTGERTFIKLMTDGILLAEVQSDRWLENYDLLIIDEAHERSLNIDFLLGYLKRLQRSRRDLKLVITSATIDTERFAQHFSDQTGKPAPVIQVSGRTYPVDVVYRPLDERSNDDEEMLTAVVDNCADLIAHEAGDILVFLPTEGDILNAAKKLRGARLAASGRPVEVLPLYARLSTEQQNLIFAPHAGTRIVLATNVAESSITVPGIRYVVDTGTARISRYAPRSKVQRLPIEAISQASANQRAGRCGRVAPGICVRLYSAEDFDSRAEFTTPEIRRTNLAGTILQLLALGLGEIDSFPFLDAPHPEAIRDGLKTLLEIGALDDRQRLTSLGRRLARLPVDPRVGRMLFAAAEEQCLTELLIIAAALEVPDPRVRPPEKQAAADAAHSQWNDPRSDFLSQLKLWDFLHQLKESTSKSQYRKALQQHFLSFNLVTQWQDVHRQLQQMVRDERQAVTPRKNDYAAIHRSLLAGLLSSIAMLKDKHEYTGAGGIQFFLWPGSGVSATRPKWIMAGEIVETTRRFGRVVAEIRPEWLEPLAGHLVKRAYVDPHWSEKSQAAIAFENVTLFGLPIVTRRRIGLGAVDPEVSRELFIEHGLVEGQLQHRFPFHQHNQALLDDVVRLANKTRRRDLLVESRTLVDFYSRRLPAEAVDVRALQQVLKSSPDLDRSLRMDFAALGLRNEAAEAAGQFPDQVKVGQIEAPVVYTFMPGEANDGATLRLPVEALGQVDDVQAGWLIPGLLVERIEALIRGLPKAQRRNLVPAPEVARSIAGGLKFGEGSFVDAVARELSRRAGEPIPPSALDAAKLPPHLLVHIQVLDRDGKTLASARSVRELHQQLPAEIRPREIAVADARWNQDHLSDWNWGELPPEVPIERGSVRIVAFPAIVDQQSGVGLRLVDSAEKAEQQSRQGLTRLLRLANRKAIKSQLAWLPGLDRAQIQLRRWLKPELLQELLGDLLVRIGMVDEQPLPRNRTQFELRQKGAVEQIGLATQELVKWLPKLAEAGQALSLALEQLSGRYAVAGTDIREQLGRLMSEPAFRETPWSWLQHLPRYLQAIQVRLQKLPGTDGKADQLAMAELQRLWNRYEQKAAEHQLQGRVDPELLKFRWLLEEYRVSLFAQQLGTSQPVSAKRLEKQWELVR
ncbi:MAG: ATP-dependent RNA helicase HrpA [Planctomycetota bacterium]